MDSPADAGPAQAGPAEPGPAAPGPAGRRPRRRGRLAVELAVELAVTIAAAVVLSVLLRTFAFETFWIPSGSMEPTLGVYDRVLVQKAFFSWHDVHQGDMVVFSQPPLDQCGGEQGTDLVKRVIALPGQAIYSQAGILYVDGKRLAEPYLPARDPLGPAIPQASAQHPYRVPAGEFYMLGDNRSDSCDSRFWGPVQGSTMVGKVVLTWWHASHPVFRWY